jgi:PIN domain nuclease of toxin-antitoxin system
MTHVLLDTHALIWLEVGHPRAKKLRRSAVPLAISPASLLEVQFLLEQGRIRLKRSARWSDFTGDSRWTLDEPPAGAWFETARGLAWTRDPFDRVIAAHALLRGFRLATADAVMLEHLGTHQLFEL